MMTTKYSDDLLKMGIQFPEYYQTLIEHGNLLKVYNKLSVDGSHSVKLERVKSVLLVLENRLKDQQNQYIRSRIDESIERNAISAEVASVEEMLATGAVAVTEADDTPCSTPQDAATPNHELANFDEKIVAENLSECQHSVASTAEFDHNISEDLNNEANTEVLATNEATVDNLDNSCQNSVASLTEQMQNISEDSNMTDAVQLSFMSAETTVDSISAPESILTRVICFREVTRESFYSQFHLIHKDEFDKMPLQRMQRKCRANANPLLTRDALEAKKRDKALRIAHRAVVRKLREEEKKERAGKLVFNFRQLPGSVRHDVNPINSLSALVPVKWLNKDTFSCFVCRDSCNKRGGKLVVCCLDCRTVYHLSCLGGPNTSEDEASSTSDLSNLLCTLCHGIVQRHLNHAELIQNNELFLDILKMSHDILMNQNYTFNVRLANNVLKRKHENTHSELSQHAKKFATNGNNFCSSK